MSTQQPPDLGTTGTPPPPPKPQRILACIDCQQRKIKCDRKTPCQNCIKSRTQCVPATQMKRERKRRFPERELLERLRKYEDLLRRNGVGFEPLHKEKEPKDRDWDDRQANTVREWSSPAETLNSEKTARNQENQETENNTESSEDDDVREAMVPLARREWHRLFEDNDHLLFGSRKTAVDISTLHPDPVKIFRLWQVYLDNVNPLLKVTHTPSLQGRIIEAVSDVSNIAPYLEALLFSIYCMAVLSLAAEDCQLMFGASKVDLLTRYQFGCQQALLNCKFLQCDDRDCLTALYLYLLSVRPNTIPQSLSSMLGVALRIAQRMGMHLESHLCKSSALEAEMRRRLWWALVMFDTRIGEMADAKTASLSMAWDCKVPLNVNDSDFHVEMKEPPVAQGRVSEALFAVLRAELGDFVRREESELGGLAAEVEEKYLRFCEGENRVHFMTMWASKSFIAKQRLMARVHQSSDAMLSHALTIISCDTKIATSPLSKGFLWYSYSYFPAGAYIHLLGSLKRKPGSELAEKAWEVMSDNHEVHFAAMEKKDGRLFFGMFTHFVMQAWEARVKFLGEGLVEPRIVVAVRKEMARVELVAKNEAFGSDVGGYDLNIPMSMDFGDQGMLFGMGGQNPYADMSGIPPLGFDVSQLDWSAVDWDLVNPPAGPSLTY